MGMRSGNPWPFLAGLFVLGFLLRISIPVSRAFAGVTGSPHDFSRTSLLTQYQSSPLSPSGPCSICHIPHGALYGVLWPRNLAVYDNALGMNGGSGGANDIPNYRWSVTVQCYDCHDSHSPPGSGFTPIDSVPAFGSFETNHKPQNIAFGFTKNAPLDSGSTMKEDSPGGTVAGYYENNPPYDNNTSTYYGADSSPGTPFKRNVLAVDNVLLQKTGGHYFKYTSPVIGSVYIGDKIPCSDCHDPHAWDALQKDWQAFFKPRALYTDGRWTTIFGSADPVASTEMANPVLPGASSRNDASSRKLCIACHGDYGTYDSVYLKLVNTAYSASDKVKRTPEKTKTGTVIPEHDSRVSQVACTKCHAHNAVDASCTKCHGDPPPPWPTSPGSYPTAYDNAHDSHAKHATAYSMSCQVCHSGSPHQDGNVQVQFDNAVLGGRLALGLDNCEQINPWVGGTSCWNLYCHSSGRINISPPASSPADYATVRWGVQTGQVRCNGCHGAFPNDNTNGDFLADNSSMRYGAPNYKNGYPNDNTKANSHKAHVGTFECSACHGNVAGSWSANSRSITNVSLHVNGTRDISIPGGSYDNVNRSCSVSSCHGSFSPRWGGTLGGCFDCHSGTEKLYKPRFDYDNVQAPNPVDNGQYLSSGHGRLRSGNYPGPDNNSGAGFANASFDNTSDCYYCHSRSAAHATKSANDPFRLGYGTDSAGQKDPVAQGAFADNTDALCLKCHGTETGWPRATKTSTQNMATHSKAVTGGSKTWPVTPWKCVDCHDPHGDGNWMMVRSGINAPNSSTDTNAGSDTQSVTKRTDGNVKAVVLTSAAGYADNSYAIPGSANWGICEVCHWQTTAYGRSLDNTASHATRTNRCATCHPHNAGFAAKACKGCHGGDNGDPGQISGNAPNITKYWMTSGHGKTSLPTMNLQCEDCHDVGYRTATDHKTDGSVPGNPPGNINTEHWPGKSPLNDNTNPNVNTAHLKSGYFKANPASRAEIAVTFDNFCATTCHKKDYHRHCKPNSCPDGAVRFGDQNTVQNPKAYNWYTQGTYVDTFYMSRSPWTDNDISLVAGLTDASTSYVTCVSCHDPHGTAVTDNSAYTFPPTATTNHMVRGKWKTDTDNFCNRACHTNRTPP